VHPVATPVSLFLKDITSGLDPVRDLLGCRIDVVCEPERLAIPIDPGQLRRAVMNLLLNAAQAAGSGGSIRLVADVHGDAVWIDVEDSGPGITEAVMRQLFTPFFTTRRGGTGLGLSIAREIVRKHGGELVPANLPEGGARFRIVLPQA
jgi:signal transduction histidine kinase